MKIVMRSSSKTMWQVRYNRGQMFSAVTNYSLCVMVHSHTRIAPVTQCVSMEANVHTLSYQRSSSNRIPAQRVCECTISLQLSRMKLEFHRTGFPRSILVTSSRGCWRKCLQQVVRVWRVGEYVRRMLRGNCCPGI